tara:strand:+ start:736 stop:1386 length:651 start_codon:yes stop_codon:yes gene_type:complete
MRIVLGAALALVALAAPGVAKPKAPKPGKVLKEAAKELSKLKSYRVDFQVLGGTAQSAEHTLTDTRVNQSWNAKVLGKVDSLNGEQAFRLRRGGDDGAILEGSNWKAMLATEKGRLISRLFERPEAALAKAYKHRKRAQWVQPKDGAQQQQASAPAPQAADADEDGTRTKKDEQKSGPGSAAESGPVSHVIRVEAPPVEAVTHFNRIVTSGCFSEG